MWQAGVALSQRGCLHRSVGVLKLPEGALVAPRGCRTRRFRRAAVRATPRCASGFLLLWRSPGSSGAAHDWDSTTSTSLRLPPEILRRRLAMLRPPLFAARRRVAALRIFVFSKSIKTGPTRACDARLPRPRPPSAVAPSFIYSSLRPFPRPDSRLAVIHPRRAAASRARAGNRPTSSPTSSSSTSSCEGHRPRASR